MNEPALKFNRDTGRYELIEIISIDAEIFQRMLYKYAEENHIDPTDLGAWAKAIEVVSRADKWRNHPHATVRTEKQVEPEVLMPVEAEPEAVTLAKRTLPPYSNTMSPKDAAVLRERARALPVERWGELLTPIPDDVPPGHAARGRYYKRRGAEGKVLNQLKQEQEAHTPLDLERLSVIASATNGARLK